MAVMVATLEGIPTGERVVNHLRPPCGTRHSCQSYTWFDIEINEEVYQKLQSKCWDGTAITYIRMAAKFGGHRAGKQLKERYKKLSPQLLESYKKLAK
jgi:hypothetical protein